jgi:hypothetical protein
MTGRSLTSQLRPRIFAGIAFVLSLALALLVLVYWRDGHPMLLIPAAASLVLILWPNRLTAWLAILATLAFVLLGLMSIGYFYLPSLVLLVVSLLSLEPRVREATA